MGRLISDKFREWEQVCEYRINSLKEAEEEINRYFIGQYGIEDELDPYVADKDITIRNADLTREIKSLISYAVGCIFGRYSLDCEGLCYAGGQWDDSKYSTIIPSAINIIPLSPSFPDNLSSRIIRFIEKVYGSDTLEENLEYIASVLGYEGHPGEVIDKYLLKDFFPDHCKIYHRRPIYWMFDSGRKCHFKALCYMHRWNPEVPFLLCERYVSPYMSEIQKLSEETAEGLKAVPSAEKPKMKRRLAKYESQLEELRVFAKKLSAHTEDIDLDDGVKVNYSKFEDVLEKIKN